MITISDNYKYFLFDMDGTLVDTEPIGPEVFLKLFSDYKVALTDDEKDLFVKVWRRDGTDIKEDDYLGSLVVKYKIQQPATDFIKEFYTRYKQAIISAKELPGVSDFLSNAEAYGKKLVLVTSSKREQAEAILDFHDWSKYFDLIISEENISKFKPDPEPFIIAMNKLNASPNQCIVFEDAKNGAIAGHAAGAYVIGLRAGNKNPHDLSSADQVVDTFNDISLRGINS